MADLIIKPAAGAGNKLIFQDQSGGAILTTTDSGAALSAAVSGGGSTDASDLVSGTLPDGRFPATLPAINGSALTNLPASTPTFTAVADGAIAAGDECIVTAAGKLAKIASSTNDVIFGPSTSGLFNDYSVSNGFRQYETYDRLWQHAQTLSPNPFASQAAMNQAAYTSWTNSSWGLYIHQDSTGGYGNMWQGSVNTSGVYSDYYLTINSISTISATGNAPNTTNVLTLFNWMAYQQLVFRFKHSATVTNMALNNFVGWADGAYADGVNATVTLKGTIETNLTGLTTGTAYYIQKNGTLGTSQDDPSVLAGVALAADKLLVS